MDDDIFFYMREPMVVNDMTNNRQNFTDDLRQIKTDRLEEKFNQMVLANQALWEILKEKLGATDRDLAEKIMEIDLRDGKLDGRLSSAPADCPKCGSKISREFNRCLFCGYNAVHSGSAFEKLTV